MKRTRFNLTPANIKKKPGRKTKYEPWMADVALRMCGFLGARNIDLAKVFEVQITTLQKWIKNKPEFAEAVTIGRLQVGTRVAEALVKKAIGFSHKETKVFQFKGEIITKDVMKYYPPDAYAADKYLKIMFRDIWSEKTSIEISGKIQHTKAEALPLDELSEKEKEVLFGLNMKQLMEPSKN